MQKKIDIIIKCVSESTMKLSVKNLILKLFEEIIIQYNLIENKYQQRIKRDNKIKSDFIDYYDKVGTLLLIM
jgi:hypothetical protein